jgi:hypothetical protein
MTNELQQTVANALTAPTRVGSGDLLGIVNVIFGSKLKDADAIDATDAWNEICAILSPDEKTAIWKRCGLGMTLEAAGKSCGTGRERIRQRVNGAIRKLQHPARIRRLEHLIMGYANLHRDA